MNQGDLSGDRTVFMQRTGRQRPAEWTHGQTGVHQQLPAVDRVPKSRPGRSQSGHSNVEAE